jgi:hypothetical protein
MWEVGYVVLLLVVLCVVAYVLISIIWDWLDEGR